MQKDFRYRALIPKQIFISVYEKFRLMKLYMISQRSKPYRSIQYV